MTGEPLDEAYFKWLYHQVAPFRLKNPARTYWSLLRQLHRKEFVWFVPNDDNRVEDGKELRYEFLNENGMNWIDEKDWLDLGCSMLEMLIALSRRLSFLSEGASSEWFWLMMDNLNLRDCTDARFPKLISPNRIDAALDDVIERKYTRAGYGGLFPLHCPEQDQRYVEIWYQMQTYLIERG